ncbi:MAG: FeoB-associated Cys-rich membrane protein [Desulfovibrio sp.]|nr:FeoB-associated Cys-rich membrane protein [Desulfovibrio sp.]
MSLDNILVFIIVACAVLFFVRRILGHIRGGQCNCGCGKSCQSKARACK